MTLLFKDPHSVDCSTFPRVLQYFHGVNILEDAKLKTFTPQYIWNANIKMYHYQIKFSFPSPAYNKCTCVCLKKNKHKNAG